MDREVLRATVHGVTGESDTTEQLSMITQSPPNSLQNSKICLVIYRHQILKAFLLEPPCLYSQLLSGASLSWEQLRIKAWRLQKERLQNLVPVDY